MIKGKMSSVVKTRITSSDWKTLAMAGESIQREKLNCAERFLVCIENPHCELNPEHIC